MSSVLAGSAVVGAEALAAKFFEMIVSPAGQQAILKVLADKKTVAAELDAALVIAANLQDPPPPSKVAP
jgi:hypothetical protein